jgi:hypothetical protein
MEIKTFKGELTPAKVNQSKNEETEFRHRMHKRTQIKKAATN